MINPYNLCPIIHSFPPSHGRQWPVTINITNRTYTFELRIDISIPVIRIEKYSEIMRCAISVNPRRSSTHVQITIWFYWIQIGMNAWIAHSINHVISLLLQQGSLRIADVTTCSNQTNAMRYGQCLINSSIASSASSFLQFSAPRSHYNNIQEVQHTKGGRTWFVKLSNIIQVSNSSVYLRPNYHNIGNCTNSWLVTSD